MGAPTTRTKPAVNGFPSRPSAAGPSHVAVPKTPQKTQGPYRSTPLRAGVQSDRKKDAGSTPGEPNVVMNATRRCRAFHKSLYKSQCYPGSRCSVFQWLSFGHIWPRRGGAAVYTVTHILELVSGVGDSECGLIVNSCKSPTGQTALALPPLPRFMKDSCHFLVWFSVLNVFSLSNA